MDFSDPTHSKTLQRARSPRATPPDGASRRRGADGDHPGRDVRGQPASGAARQEPRGRKVAILIYDGLCAFEYGVASEIFAAGPPTPGPAWYVCVTCAENGGWIQGLGGLKVQAGADLGALSTADTVVIPGWSEDLVASPNVSAAVAAAHARGARIVAMCTGAFVVGAAGLADGREVVTHWRYAEAFQSRFPMAHYAGDRLFVTDSGVHTSAGATAALDMLLAIVAEDFGAVRARALAESLVMYVPREGRQAQRVRAPTVRRRGDAFGRTLDTIRSRLEEPWSLAKMADVACVSKRTLIRRFAQAHGCSPGAWLVAQRVAAAQGLLESSDHSVEDIAAACGFGSATAMRHHIRRLFRVSPTDLRRRLSRPTSPSAGELEMPGLPRDPRRGSPASNAPRRAGRPTWA